MEALIFPVLLVAVVSILAGLILAFAAKFFAVEVDERVTQIRECLPGANCGGCGFAGCDDYAASLVANPELATNLCTVGGPAVAQKISEILGVSFEAATPKHALVHCNGTCQNTKYAIDYEGPQTCRRLQHHVRRAAAPAITGALALATVWPPATMTPSI